MAATEVAAISKSFKEQGPMPANRNSRNQDFPDLPYAVSDRAFSGAQSKPHRDRSADASGFQQRPDRGPELSSVAAKFH